MSVDAFHHPGVSDKLFKYLMDNRQSIISFSYRFCYNATPHIFEPVQVAVDCNKCFLYASNIYKYMMPKDSPIGIDYCNRLSKYVYDVTCLLYPEDVFEELL